MAREYTRKEITALFKAFAHAAGPCDRRTMGTLLRNWHDTRFRLNLADNSLEANCEDLSHYLPGGVFERKRTCISEYALLDDN